MIVMPIIVLFFESKGLSLTQIMILQGTYSLFVALFEIPSGFFADIYGRKNSLVIGSIFWFLGYVIFSFFSGFNEFLFAEILLGIGGSLISGADSAILYDTLLEIKEEDEYTKIEGRTYAIGNFSEGIAGVLGGFLAMTSINMPVYIQTIVMFLSIPIAMTLVEPRSSYKLAKSFSSIITVVKDTFIYQRKLRWYIVYSSSMGIATLSIAWFVQPFLIEIEAAWRLCLNIETSFIAKKNFSIPWLFFTFISNGDIVIIFAFDNFLLIFFGENLFIRKP